ncbi:MAG: hypothetical protein MHM6MM_005493 [Cercozoa sp. M6MM]
MATKSPTSSTNGSERIKRPEQRPAPPRVSHFTAVQIENAALCQQLVQCESALKEIADFRKYKFPGKHHITLNLFSEKSFGDEEFSEDLLRERFEQFTVSETLASALKAQSQVSFSDIGNFGSRVLFVDCDAESQHVLRTLSDALHQHMAEGNILPLQKERFSPHLTLFKWRPRFPRMRRPGVVKFRHILTDFRHRFAASVLAKDSQSDLPLDETTSSSSTESTSESEEAPQINHWHSQPIVKIQLLKCRTTESGYYHVVSELRLSY